MKRESLAAFTALFFLIAFCRVASGQGAKADYERAEQLAKLVEGKVARDSVRTNWIGETGLFWYRVTTAAGHEFVVVDPGRSAREPAFDHDALAAALEAATGNEVSASALPLEEFSLDAAGAEPAIRFKAFGKGWQWNRSSAELAEVETTSREEPAPREDGRQRGRRRGGAAGERQRPASPDAKSPDGKWEVFTRDFDVHVRNLGSGEETPLTFDGIEENRYDDRVFWCNDSLHFVATRTRPAQEHKVHMVESSPADQVQPKLKTIDYLKPGDRIEQTKPALFSIEGDAAPRRVEVSDALFPEPWEVSHFRWSPDGREFRFLYNERGHQVMRVIGINAGSGVARAIINEECATFFDYAHKTFLRYLEDSDELIWMSERDGWNHLYLVDASRGTVKNQITRGEWVVRGVEWLDEKARRVVFRGNGIHPGQDPYHIHYASVGFDGDDLRLLTTGDGTHEADFSPDRRYFVDQWSRVDKPPVHELRGVETGELVVPLEEADAGRLFELGWKAPERFTAKGRDGQTDIYGIIHRPVAFDESKKYPVIELIYAGPHDSHVPKAWRSNYRCRGLAELGFIVVQIDGMGTSNRGKKFQDICWKNLKDAGFPDRIPWIKAAAEKYPFMDLSKGVGIYGGSAGGQNALGGLLFHPEFYTVGVADCGCHDNRMDKIWWNEAWMGRMGPHYADNSNVTHAHRLQGKLFLTVGELDTNVDPASTMQVVNALIKADKDFDFVIVPGAGHGIGESPYLMRRRSDFFVRHLYGIEPRSR